MGPLNEDAACRRVSPEDRTGGLGLRPQADVRCCSGRPPLAADRAHRPVRLVERRVADVVPGLLAGQAPTERLGQRLVDVVRSGCRARRRDRPDAHRLLGPDADGRTLRRRCAAQQLADVGLRLREQAGAQLAVGREPEPVARAAERCVTEAMTPTVAGPPSTVQSSAGAAPRPGTSVRVNALVRRDRISACVTISARSHVCPPSSGICSMNRIWYPWSTANRVRATTSSSFTPRIATALILT